MYNHISVLIPQRVEGEQLERIRPSPQREQGESLAALLEANQFATDHCTMI